MLCLLGEPRALVAGRTERLRLRPKTWALLARLALTEGPSRRRDLADLLFEEANDPRAALRWHLLDLRRQLPEPLRACLRSERDAVSLAAPTDVGGFLGGLSAGASEADAAVALDLYEGDFCADLAVSASSDFDTWLWVEQDALRRRFRHGVLDLVRRNTGVQDEGTVALLTRLLTVDPYCEDGHVALIETLEASGQPDAARKAYFRYERLLHEDLGAAPRQDLAVRFGGLTSPARELPREGPVPLSDVTLNVVAWEGNGPTVLALHGTAGNAHTLALLANRLTPNLRFLAPDLRGHGFSDKPPSGYTLERHADDITELITALGLERPVLLGFSLGGNLAVEVASRVELSGLILLEGVIGKRAFFENAAAKTVPFFEATSRRHFGGFVEYLERAAQTPASDEVEAYLKQRARFDLLPVKAGQLRPRSLTAAILESWLSAASTDSLATLRRVACPVLLVQAKLPWIGDQAYLPDDAFADQLEACPDACVFEANRSNHASLIRDPEPGLVETITDFVFQSSSADRRMPRPHPAGRV